MLTDRLHSESFCEYNDIFINSNLTHQLQQPTQHLLFSSVPSYQLFFLSLDNKISLIQLLCRLCIFV